MMFCMNTEIICTDLIKLEQRIDRKRKDGSERHCLGVAPLLFILSKHSIILIPPSPTVAGQQQGSGKQHDPEPARGMQTWQGSAWRIRQHLGEVSPAIPRQAQAKHPTTHTRVKKICVVPISTRALGQAGLREKQLGNSLTHTLTGILLFILRINPMPRRPGHRGLRTAPPWCSGICSTQVTRANSSCHRQHRNSGQHRKTIPRWEFKQNTSHLLSKPGKSGKFPT